jgi:hypothetical protein
MPGENEEIEELSGDFEREARNMGWLPKEQFPGNPDEWIDAKQFIEKGQQVIPILRANNKRLQRELLTRDQKIGNLETAIKNSQKAIETLEKHYTAANKRAIENAKRQLVEQIKEAREAGDTDAEFKLLDQLDVVKDSEKSAKEAEEKKASARQSGGEEEPAALSPDFNRFQEENPWFGEDRKRTKTLLRIGEDLREEGNTKQGYAFMQDCLEVLKKSDESSERRTTSKVEGSRSGSSSGGGKSFKDLPADAKQACWDDADELVGKDKRYKTKAEWEKRYAEIYFGEG